MELKERMVYIHICSVAYQRHLEWGLYEVKKLYKKISLIKGTVIALPDSHPSKTIAFLDSRLCDHEDIQKKRIVKMQQSMQFLTLR